MLQFSCPSCGKSLKVNSEAAGRRLVCPACKGQVLVPAVRPAPAASEDDVVSWLDEAPQAAEPASVQAPARQEEGDEMYRLAPLESAPSEAAAHEPERGLAQDSNLPAESPGRGRRAERAFDSESPALADKPARAAKERGGWGKHLSTVGLMALLAGMGWFLWRTFAPNYHYHVDEETRPATLEVHRGKGDGAAVATFKLGEEESYSPAGPRGVVAGSQTARDALGEWEVAFDKHMWTGRTRVVVKRNGVAVPPCDRELARLEDCRREIADALKDGIFQARFEQMVANLSGQTPPAEPVLRSKLLFEIYLQNSNGPSGSLLLAIDNPPMQGRLEAHDCVMQWDLHKSDYSVTCYGVPLTPAPEYEDPYGRMVRQAAVHPDVVYRFEPQQSEASAEQASPVNAILIERSTGKTIVRLPVVAGYFVVEQDQKFTRAEWDRNVNRITVQYLGKDVAPIPEQSEPSTTPLETTVEERR